MGTHAERILRIISLASHPLDDDEIAQRMGIVRQNVNQVCRQMEAQGVLRRAVGADGKIVNELVGKPRPPAPAQTQAQAQAPASSSTTIASVLMAEDSVKRAVADYFRARGLDVQVRWGRDRGIDILATGPGERWIVEAKGEVASDQQQGNYFLGALGELIQRMDDPNARYALALPNNRRYRGLVARLPRLARQRLNLAILFVGPGSTVTEDTL